MLFGLFNKELIKNSRLERDKLLLENLRVVILEEGISVNNIFKVLISTKIFF